VVFASYRIYKYLNKRKLLKKENIYDE